mgnify:CR=1 FL=1
MNDIHKATHTEKLEDNKHEEIANPRLCVNVGSTNFSSGHVATVSGDRNNGISRISNGNHLLNCSGKQAIHNHQFLRIGEVPSFNYNHSQNSRRNYRGAPNVNQISSKEYEKENKIMVTLPKFKKSPNPTDVRVSREGKGGFKGLYGQNFYSAPFKNLDRYKKQE